MKDLSPQARRCILHIIIIAAIIIAAVLTFWESAHLPEKSLGGSLILILLLHIVGTSLFKDHSPSDQMSNMKESKNASNRSNDEQSLTNW